MNAELEKEKAKEKAKEEMKSEGNKEGDAILERVKVLEALCEEMKKREKEMKGEIVVVGEGMTTNRKEIEELKKRMAEQFGSNSKQLNQLLVSLNKTEANVKNEDDHGRAEDAKEEVKSKEQDISSKSEGNKGISEEISMNMACIENSLRELLKRFEFKADKEDVAKLSGATSELKERVDKMEKAMVQFEKEFARNSLNEISNNSTTINQTSDFSITEKEWNDCRTLLEKLNADNDKILLDLQSLQPLKDKFTLLHARLETKMDRDEFSRWAAENDLSQILSGVVKKFADRNEMLRALKKLEKRLVLLEEVMHSEDNAESAMLAKKPLGGWSCASCQKEIVNLEGVRTQYYPWAKFPQRHPTERIAKVGQGFSRMLAMIKPEEASHSQRVVLHKKYEEDFKEEPKPLNEGSDGISLFKS